MVRRAHPENACWAKHCVVMFEHGIVRRHLLDDVPFFVDDRVPDPNQACALPRPFEGHNVLRPVGTSGLVLALELLESSGLGLEVLFIAVGEEKELIEAGVFQRRSKNHECRCNVRIRELGGCPEMVSQPASVFSELDVVAPHRLSVRAPQCTVERVQERYEALGGRRELRVFRLNRVCPMKEPHVLIGLLQTIDPRIEQGRRQNPQLLSIDGHQPSFDPLRIGTYALGYPLENVRILFQCFVSPTARAPE